ncbi:hypothetical protein THAOC_13463 [Thalassiosira oceanica]|uniref:RWD domain-containing protein n=1 Tax=Thalassiosira oceanica TaxID=159749 RepID=K0SL29_THAOC|nr:hypothetical protein THAOC_13463 [Thalassiosira oceanica]|eukprot:EJK65654.1 hypothetical protein THAOC_13463 [Thalassiosira oceanica]
MSTEDCERAQEDELEALLAIFPDDIVLRDEDDEDESGPTRPATASYSVRLRGEGIPFVLNVRCPPTYPDLSTPDFEVGYDGDGPARLHAVQEAAVVGVASRAARAGWGLRRSTPPCSPCGSSWRTTASPRRPSRSSGTTAWPLVLRFAAATREDVDAVRRALARLPRRGAVERAVGADLPDKVAVEVRVREADEEGEEGRATRRGGPTSASG